MHEYPHAQPNPERGSGDCIITAILGSSFRIGCFELAQHSGLRLSRVPEQLFDHRPC